MGDHWQWTDVDRDIAADLNAIIPDDVFDVHAHLYRRSDMPGTEKELLDAGPDVVGLDAWRASMGSMLGAGRASGGLFISMPYASLDVAAGNTFVLEQIEPLEDARASIVIRPEMDPDGLAELVAHPRVVGLKPYHLMSAETPTWQAPLESYLPEWAWKLADEHGLAITLHMVRDRALSDPDNQREIRSWCERYPNARLILAHAARGFHSDNTVNGVAALRALPNVYFDTSGICESRAIKAILREFGPSRVMWGSDFPVCEQRGRCVTIGDAFSWINPDRIDVADDAPPLQTIAVGLEGLRAMREVIEDMALSEADVAAIFAGNARRLLGLAGGTGTKTQDLYRHAKQRIPGGTNLLSKRPELMAPNVWPPYYDEARGCEIRDLDGNHYYDFSMGGIGATLLGYADPDVTRAVQRRVNMGSMATLNPWEEVELADLLCEIHPWAEQARFARTGGEGAAVAVRIARSTTDRSHVAICGYHGWHDWYLAANLGVDDSLLGHLLPGLDPLGVPRELRGTTHPFTYNNREEFKAVLDEFGDRLACVVMEPCRHHAPEEGFLEFVRDEAHKAGAILIFDEITIGWRLHFGGSHLKFGVNPDMACFAKTTSNGYPMAAVIGTEAAMEGAHRSFISSAFWTEGVGPAAALAAIRKMRRVDVSGHVARIGTTIQDLWRRRIAEHKLPATVEDGFPCLPTFKFEHELSQELRTLYTHLMLERGFMAGPTVYMMFAHKGEHVARFDAAVDEVFGEIAEILARGDVEKELRGPVAHTGFRRLVDDSKTLNG